MSTKFQTVKQIAVQWLRVNFSNSSLHISRFPIWTFITTKFNFSNFDISHMILNNIGNSKSPHWKRLIW